MESLHLWQIQLIHELHHFRNEWLDFFFRFLNFFDTEVFYFSILPIIWLGYDWKWGAKIFFILMFSFLITIDLKEFFAQPRPFILEPQVGLVHVNGFGLPSGAALTSTAVWGFLALTWKKRWGWILAISYILILSFSRVYLGVHFFSDILLGWILGSAIAWVSYQTMPFIERWFSKATPMQATWVIMGVPILLYLPYITVTGIRVVATTMGAGLGLYWAFRKSLLLKTSKSWLQGAIRAFVGLLGVLIIFTLFQLLPITNLSHLKNFSCVVAYLKFFLCGIWISCLAPVVCKIVKCA